MLKITFYYHHSNTVFCADIAEKLKFTGFKISLSEDIVHIESDLLIIFCSENINLSESALSFINSRNKEEFNNIIPVIFKGTVCPDILNNYNKIIIEPGANIQAARKIINYIVYRILHKRSPDLQFITVKIHDLRNDNFLGNGTIISPNGDIVTSGEVLRKTQKPLSSLAQTKFGIVIPWIVGFSQDVLQASISMVYEDIAPFEVVLLKIEDNSFFTGDRSYAPLMPYQPAFNLKFKSYAWTDYSYSEINGNIRDTNQNTDHYIKKFISARFTCGISNIYCGSPILSEDNHCVIGVIILVKPLPGYEPNQAICCTSNLLKNEFGIDTIFNSPIINAIISDRIEIKSQNMEGTITSNKNIRPAKSNALENENNLLFSAKNEMISKQPKVFLCYAKEDIIKVRNLYNKLLKDGINVWLDEKNIRPGDDWELAIAKAIQESSRVIICLSKKSTEKKGYINKEIKSCTNQADKMPEGGNFIIPLRFEQCKVPFTLQKYHYIDYRKDYHKLIDELRKI